MPIPDFRALRACTLAIVIMCCIDPSTAAARNNGAGLQAITPAGQDEGSQAQVKVPEAPANAADSRGEHANAGAQNRVPAKGFAIAGVVRVEEPKPARHTRPVPAVLDAVGGDELRITLSGTLSNGVKYVAR